jgi:hypothetical protein
LNLKELINEINKSVDHLDLVATRKYMEENLDLVKQHKVLLNSNARELLDFVAKRIDSGIEPMKRYELAVIHSINIYASRFDLRGLKMVIKDHPQLLLREDAAQYLNADAKIILEGMEAIVK